MSKKKPAKKSVKKKDKSVKAAVVAPVLDLGGAVIITPIENDIVSDKSSPVVIYNPLPDSK